MEESVQTSKSNPKRKPSRKRKTHQFSYGNSSGYANKIPSQNFMRPTVAGTSVQQGNNSNFVNFLNSHSDFASMHREEIIEHMYIMEPEVSAAIDSFALMVREAFQYFDIIADTEYDNLPEKLEVANTTIDLTNTNKNLAKEMVDVANKISDVLDIPSLYETYSSLLYMHGNLYLKINKNLSLTVLPNDRVTLIDDKNRISQGNFSTGYTNLIKNANYLVVDEGLDTQFILNPGEFIIVKFRDTPLYVEDSKYRNTYGIYSISPLRRAIIPVWYKRILLANDALWRYKSVPRMDHELSSDAFSTANYTGSPEARMQKAIAEANAALTAHADAMKEQAPDEAFIHLDTIKIKNIEQSSGGYMQANELIDQTNDAIFSAINMPRSIIEGVSKSSYAAELIIYSYTSTKVTQIANKISRVILDIMKQRLLLVNPQYPVELLTIKCLYNSTSNEIEDFKSAVMMKDLGVFTDDEIRAKVKYKPLTEEQRNSGRIINTQQPKSSQTEERMSTRMMNSNSLGINSNGTVNYPTSPQSSTQQSTDSGQAVINKSTQSMNPSKRR